MQGAPPCYNATSRTASQPIEDTSDTEVDVPDRLGLQAGSVPETSRELKTPGAPRFGFPHCQPAHRSSVGHRGIVRLEFKLIVADDLDQQNGIVPRASRVCLRTPRPITAPYSASQPAKPPVRRATRQEPTSIVPGW